MGSFRRVQPAYQLIVGVAALVLLFVTLYFYGRHVWTVFGGPTVDDSAISYAYAHSIAKGHGVRLSPGTHPVEGFSNALEVLALVPFAMADWNLDLAAKGINLAFLLAGMLAWGLFLWRGLTGYSRLFAAAPCLAPFLWPSFNYWTVAGLEGGILAGLQMLALLALVSRDRAWRSEALLGVLAGLLVLARPEGACYGAIVIAAGLLRSPRRWRAGIIFLGMGVCVLLCRYAVFRDLVPNTYWAKVGDQNVWKVGIDYVGGFLNLNGKVYFFCLLPLLIPFARRAHLPALAASLQAGFALYFAARVGGDWMRHWRFMQALQGPVFALFALGAWAALSPVSIALRRLPSFLRVAIAAGLVLPLIWVNAPLGKWKDRAQAVSSQRDVDMRKIAICAGYYRELGDTLRLGRRLFIADIDVGGMAYPPGLDVLDLAGLTDRTMGYSWTRQPAAIVDYLFGERRPDTIHLHGAWFTNRPVHTFTPFAIDYREMQPLFLHNLRMGPMTVVKAALVDPPASPVVKVGLPVENIVIDGLSGYSDDKKSMLFVHATVGGGIALPALRWVNAAGESLPTVWHQGYDVNNGPAGSTVIGHVVMTEIKLPIRLDGVGYSLNEWPVMPGTSDTIAGLSQHSLLRLGGFHVPACDPGAVLDPKASEPARARGIAFLANTCLEGISSDDRREFARQIWRGIHRASDADDRYDMAAAILSMSVPLSASQVSFLEEARASHTAIDEVSLAFAARELGTGLPSATAISVGSSILLGSRSYERLLNLAIARGWLDLPEAASAVCAAARALGIKAGALSARADRCGDAPGPAVTVRRQDFENRDEPTLRFSGAAKEWIREAGLPRLLGGRGKMRLRSWKGNAAKATGEVVWGPFPWSGRRFGALLAGGGPESYVAVEGHDNTRWVEFARLSAPGTTDLMRPYLAVLPRGNWSDIRVRIVDRSVEGGFSVDGLVFIGGID